MASCGSCAQRRAALLAAEVKYHWTPPEGSDLEPETYSSEVVAKAKVMRRGGTYVPVSGNS